MGSWQSHVLCLCCSFPDNGKQWKPAKLGKAESPPIWNWGSRQAISSHLYLVTGTSDVRGPLWRAWKEPTESTNGTLSIFAGFYLSSSPNSLWVKELGMALAPSSSMAPLLPSTGQTFPAIQALRLKASIMFGPGNSYLQRNISKRIKHFFFPWLQDENWCILATLWGKNTLEALYCCLHKH